MSMIARPGGGVPGSRVFAVSDLHVDFRPNMAWVESIPRGPYASDVLIVAGDVSDRLTHLTRALAALRERFARVFFAPGNHELWIREEDFTDSLHKHETVLALCRWLGVDVEPAWVHTARGDRGVWIVPLLSWYVRPEEGDGHLFRPKPGEDPTLSMWTDNYLVRWPADAHLGRPADRFLGRNEHLLSRRWDAPVITFSHFLPRQDLIFSTPEERRSDPLVSRDETPTFNFTRVAGDARLDRQLRRIGSVMHVYGHQHRNRWRSVDGVLYVSNCLGTPRGIQYPLPASPEAPLLQIW